MIDNSVIGERVQRLRMASGISQAELASALGFKGNSSISKIENGRAVVDEHVLTSLAQQLDCTPEYLRRCDVEVIATKPWLRAYADAPAKVVDSVIADNRLVYELANRQGLSWVPDTIPLFDGDLNDEHAIERFAEEVRAAADIAESGVVRNAMRAAERLGCVILPLGHELGRHLGLSQRIDGRPFIRVSRAGGGSGESRVPGDRQRFTVVHELGHVCLHSTLRPPETADEARRIENQAHRFAAAFLAPAGPLLEDWHSIGGRVTLRVLQELKGTWGFSIKALVTRFRHLGIVDDDQARSLYRQISARGWNTSEPMPVSNEEPIWLVRALKKTFPAPDLYDSVVAAAMTHGIGEGYVRGWIDWRSTDLTDGTGHVVPLAGRPRKRLGLEKSGNSRQLGESGAGKVMTLRRPTLSDR